MSSPDFCQPARKHGICYHQVKAATSASGCMCLDVVTASAAELLLVWMSVDVSSGSDNVEGGHTNMYELNT